MKRFVLFLVAISCSLLSGDAYAQSQENNDVTIQSVERNEKDNTLKHINFSGSANLHPAEAQAIFKKYAGVNNTNEAVRLVSSTKTKQGTVIDRYAQYYQGLKVEYSSFILMSKNDRVEFANMNVFNVPVGQSASPSLTEPVALEKALTKIGAEKYMWQDTAMERFFRMISHKDTTYFPKGNLVWIEDMSLPVNEMNRQLHLAYCFDVYAEKPVSRNNVYVDATTGKILFVNSMMQSTSATGNSLYSGNVTFETILASGLYYLQDASRGAAVRTYTLNNLTSGGSSQTNATTTWASDASLDAHWGAEKVYDYWWNEQGRASFDNANSQLVSFTHYGVNYDNAFWNGSQMIYGDGSGSGSGGFDALVALDVCAHELGHAVCQYTAGLVYSLESGAMNEGFSDIWGSVIENYADPHETDAKAKSKYDIGEEISTSPLRSMSNPNSHGQPDTYTGTNWTNITSCVPQGNSSLPGYNDYCYVHKHSGVLNYWFYLISNGGSGTNDLGNAFSVTSIGMTKAADVAYQTELLLGSTDNYAAARTASINAATTLYGSCSAEVIAVTKAWYAVGVGANFTATVPVAISGTKTVCQSNITSLTNSTSGGTWTSNSTSIASVNSSGVVTGASAGTTTITYTITTGGCYTTAAVTVNATPLAISGTTNVCVSATTALTDAGGGTWASSNTTVATIAATGVVSGLVAGTTVITYTLGTGCRVTTPVTVNTLPLSISGTLQACPLSSTNLTNSGGGTWASSTTTIATVSGSGVVTGVAAGTTTITYTLGTGCRTTSVVTINPLPSAITGTQSVCVSSTTALTDAGGGTWSTANTTATVGLGTGVVSGVAAGTATITYTLGTGCQATAIVTVNALPGTISGTRQACPGTNTTLSAAGGGAWTSGATTVATVVSGTGVVSGLTVGTTTITYTLSTGCSATTIVTVNPLPSAISGTFTVCQSATTALTDAGGGTWGSSTTTVATVVSGSGVVTGAGAGTTTITYTLGTGCQATAVVTVLAAPAAISGTKNVCVGLTTALTDAGGGTWASSNTSQATVDAAGVVTGMAAGTPTITYTLGTGCFATTLVTVNPLPSAISGSSSVCVSGNTTLTNSGGGTWTSSNTSIATVVLGSGVVNGVTTGSATITYTLGTGCITTMPVTVNPLPGAITGTGVVCVGLTTALTDAGGGNWATANTATATVVLGTGVVTGVAGGTATITYTLGTGCAATSVVTVNPLPANISGATAVCVGSAVTLSNSTGTGTWSSSNTSVATIVVGSGFLSGLTAGTSVVTYALSTGCLKTTTITVNALPGAITGTMSVCVGNTTALTDVGGGAWSSSTTTVATVLPATGVVSGVLAGTATITYTLGVGCYVNTVVTVNPLPSAISGIATVCAGLTTTLSNSGGGAWSSTNTTVATVDVAGVITGNTAGTSTVSYTLPVTGCASFRVITVNPLPAAISGTPTVCISSSTSLTDAGGGTWSSSVTTIATVGLSTGIVNGSSAGTTTITYILGTGCLITAVVTVNPLPSAITGTAAVCAGLSTTLSNSGGGNWTSGNTTVATVLPASGIVSGLVAGTSVITYSLPTGCRTTIVATVNPLPAAISGMPTVCIGLSTALTDAGGGTWASSNTSIATAGLSTGVVTGVAAGTSAITYTLGTGCIISTVVTVNPFPTAITGAMSVCAGLTTTLSNAGGGTWGSSNTTVATVGFATGVVSASVAGTATITYTAGAGCTATTVVTVNSLPSAILGSPAVCAGLSITLSNTGGGTWTSSTSSVASIDLATGVVSANVAGTTAITYALPTGCIITKTITVNPLPSAISGSTYICAGASITLSDAGGGTWTSGTTSVASVGLSTGVVNALTVGTTSITYTLSTGCITTTAVTVSIIPTAISGIGNMCAGLTTTLSNSVAGGAWTSGNTTVATILPGTGVVSGLVAGTTVITYSVGASCTTTTVATVNPLPAAISGVTNVCVGLTTALTDAGGGTWTSSTTSVATVALSTGVVSGVLAGTTTITYTLPTGCITLAAVTVNPVPSAISGVTNVCAGLTTTLSNAGGGTWGSSNTAVATVNSTTGLVAGIVAGTITITYTLPTGCITLSAVTVNPLPNAISGTFNVCEGLTTTLSDAGGGTWTSGNTTIATVISGTGVVTGVVAGTSSVTYTLPTGCITQAVVTVDPLPSSIFGLANVCEGLSITLGNIGGGTWTGSNTTIATIGLGTGVVSGILAGTTTVTYTLPTGCITTKIITVDPLPAAITGTAIVCQGSATTLSDIGGGTWTSGNTSIALAGLSTGIITGVSGGTATVTYTLGTGCIATIVTTVDPLPATISGVAYVCTGLTTTVSNATPSGTWSSSNTIIATISSGGMINGLLAGTSTITYTLPTGCYVTRTATVNPLPSAITGTFTVCPGLTAALTDAGGGSWTSNNTSIATVSVGTGIVTGVTPGSTTITYTLGTGCTTTATFTVNGLPIVPAITGGNEVCATLNIALSNSLSGGVWTSSNTSMATVVGGVVTGASAGVVNISYSATNVCGTTSPIHSVTVHALPVIAPMSGVPSTCISIVSALSDATPSGVWSSTNTAVATVSGTGAVIGITAGTTIISYTLINTFGCINAASTLFTVDPPLSITATPASSTNFCTGGFVTLNATTGPGFLYQWQVGGLDLPGATSSSYVANFTGNYTVVVTGVGICRSLSPLVTVLVSPSPIVVPSVSLTTSTDTILCVATAPVTFTPHPVNGGSAPVYNWYVNGIATAAGATFTYSPFSGDMIMCRLTSNATCVFPDTAIASQKIIISPLVTSTIGIGVTPSDVVCDGTLTTFNTTITGGGTTPAYVWKKNGVVVATGSSYAYLPANGDVVFCTMASSFPCLTAPAVATPPVTMTVNPNVINKDSIFATRRTIGVGQIDTFVVVATNGGTSPIYQWNINSIPVPGETAPMFITNDLVDGDVVICSETSSEMCALPKTATSNSFRIRVISGIDATNAMTNFTLIPNPNKGEFTISGKVGNGIDGQVNIVMTNMLGQAIYSNSVPVNNGSISKHVVLSNTIANGMYLVKISNGANQQVFHVVVER